MSEQHDFRAIPKRKISEADKHIISLKIELMKLRREKSLLILGSSIILFFTFIIVAIIGILNGLMGPNQLNILIIIALVALVIGVIPYIRFVVHEEKSLEKTLESLVS